MHTTLPLRLALVAAALVVVAGCGSSSDAPPPGPFPPIVTMTAPDDGDTVGGMVMLMADVDTGSAAVDQVEFFYGSTSIGIDDTAPYTMMWDTTNVQDDSYTVMAEATDGNGLTDDDSIEVIVFNFTHAGYFATNPYLGTATDPELGTAQCLQCHSDVGDDIITTGHYKWRGTASNIAGYENEVHGKIDIVNNFCIAVYTNEPRCTQCHIGYGWADNSFDFTDPTSVDCLVCHDQTATYIKNPKTAGRPDSSVDLNAVAMSVGDNDGVPGRYGCIHCHAKAGGGDNVKHGDIAMNLLSTTREFDVHMGTDGGDMNCVDCHRVQKDGSDNVLSHGIGGMPYHSVGEGDMQDCGDCHGDIDSIHAGKTVANIISNPAHDGKFACQVCHVPVFARVTPTKVWWDWSKAGPDNQPDVIEEDPPGYPLWNVMKGEFRFGNNVRPAWRYHDRTWYKMLVGVNDRFTGEGPVVLGAPLADYQTAGALIYPFKKMEGKQAYDVVLSRILVPHLFGMQSGDNPFWQTPPAGYDWELSLQDGEDYITPIVPEYAFNGTFDDDPDTGDFIETVMYLTVNHEVPPAQQALGVTGNCADCHGVYDFTELGYTADPLFENGTRP